MTKSLKFIIAIIILVGIGSAASFFLQNKTHIPDSEASPVVSAVIPSPSGPIDPDILSKPADPPPGYVKYHNDRYNFSFYHGPHGVVTEYDEGQGAMTVVLENEHRVRGLQIFIVPYPEDKISEARFKADVPSGVRTNVDTVYIGLLGVQAVTFNSYDSFLGDTREVWFIHDHLLFEVTTFKGVGDWFTPIMQTWRFF